MPPAKLLLPGEALQFFRNAQASHAAGTILWARRAVGVDECGVLVAGAVLTEAPAAGTFIWMRRVYKTITVRACGTPVMNNVEKSDATDSRDLPEWNLSIHPSLKHGYQTDLFWMWANLSIACAYSLGAIALFWMKGQEGLQLFFTKPILWLFSFFILVHCIRMFLHYHHRIQRLRDCSLVINHGPSEEAFVSVRPSKLGLREVMITYNGSIAQYKVWCGEIVGTDTVIVYLDPLTRRPIAIEQDGQIALIHPGQAECVNLIRGSAPNE